MDLFTFFKQLGAVIFIVGIIMLAIPGVIAFKRNHSYKWLILVIGLLGGGISGGALWLVAIVWSLWPEDKSLADPILGSPTGLSRRNVGDTVGVVKAGEERGYATEKMESKNVETTIHIHQELNDNKTIEKSIYKFSGEASINNDAYKIYLVKKYNIENNSVLNKFILNEKLFNNIEDVLIFADELEKQEYKIYLVQKYNIENNSVLNKFIINEKLFNNIEEVLIFADELEKQESKAPIQASAPASAEVPIHAQESTSRSSPDIANKKVMAIANNDNSNLGKKNIVKTNKEDHTGLTKILLVILILFVLMGIISNIPM